MCLERRWRLRLISHFNRSSGDLKINDSDMSGRSSSSPEQRSHSLRVKSQRPSLALMGSTFNLTLVKERSKMNFTIS